MKIRLEWDRPVRPPAAARMTAVLLVGVMPETVSVSGHDACVLLDTSKSMAGDKLQRALEACRLAAQSLGPDDRLAVCTFASNVSTLVPLTSTGGVLEAALAVALENVQAGGCTLTYAALLHAQSVLAERTDASRPATVLLITDGHPTDNRGRPMTDMSPLVEVADSLASRALTLTPIGLGSGNDFNTGVLESLADHGRGAFCHAEDPAGLSALLEERLRRAGQVACASASMTVEPTGCGATVEGACRIAPEYAELPVPQGAAVLALGQLPAEPESVFLLRIGTGGRFGAEGPEPVARIAVRATDDSASADAALDFSNTPREQQRVNEEANRLRLAWDLARYQQMVNASDDAGRTGDLLAQIRNTGELIGSQAVVDDASARLHELRATGALSGNANARATSMLRATGELLSHAGAVAEPTGAEPERVTEVVTSPESNSGSGGGIGFGGGQEQPRREQEEAAPVQPASQGGALAPDSARLVVRRGARPGAAYALSAPEAHIGRTAPGITVDIDLSDQETGDRYTVSRRHALVTWDGGRCLIRDQGSKAGTVVNGRPITAPSGNVPAEVVELHPGDRVILGCLELEVTAGG